MPYAQYMEGIIGMLLSGGLDWDLIHHGMHARARDRVGTGWQDRCTALGGRVPKGMACARSSTARLKSTSIAIWTLRMNV